MILRHISEHTLQMNAWIGLCQLDSHYPNTLRRLGYTVDALDPKFTHNGKQVNPDLVLTSRSGNHCIVVDCKQWFIKDSQNERYSELLSESEVLINRGIVRGLGPENHAADFSYSSFRDLSENDHLPNNEFAVVHFDIDADPIEISTVDTHPFQNRDVATQLPIIGSAGGKIPTDYFPFDAGIKDDEEQFIVSLLQSTVHIALKNEEFDIDDLLADAHPLWIDMDAEKKDEFRSRTEQLIDLYSKKGLSEHIEKVNSSRTAEWRVISKSLRALQRKLDQFIEEARIELEQTRLDDFENAGS